MRPAAAAAVLLALAGCAGVSRLADGYRDAYRVAPDVAGDGWLRASLERGAFDSALVRLTTGHEAPGDALLRALFAGLVAHYGGQRSVSARAFAEADAVADDRYTKSLSRNGISLLTSDLVLPYTAGRTERLLVHYYGVLGYLEQDSVAAAAVEARRLSKLLEQYGDDRSPDERATHGVLHYLAGVAFEAAGERTDAAVAYRNAAALTGDSVLAALAERPAARTTPTPRSRRSPTPGGQPDALPTGDVVVVVEQGYVGRRVEQTATVGLDSSELVRLASGEADTSLAERIVRRLFQPGARPVAIPPDAPGVHGTFATGGAAGGVARAIRQAATAGPQARAPERNVPSLPSDAHPSIPSAPARVEADDRAPGYFLRLAWPAFLRPPREPAPLAVTADGQVARRGAPASVALRYRADLSDAAARDFERQRVALVTRSVARAAAKYWATRTARKRGGRLGGAMVNAATALLERADTRSWSLLPGTVSVARLSLPAGVHTMFVEFPAGGGAPRRVAVGDVTVRAGRVTVLSTRFWGDGQRLTPPIAPPVAPTAPGLAVGGAGDAP